MMDVKTVPFKAFPDQKAGTYVSSLPLPLIFRPSSSPAKKHVGYRGSRTTWMLTKSSRSGLRKKVTVFQTEHYSESFIASILLSIPEGVEGADLMRC